MSRVFEVEERDGQFFAPDGRRAYPVTCYACRHQFHACQSFAMLGDWNRGGGACPSCDTYLNLEMTPDLDGDAMIASIHPCDQPLPPS